MIDIKRLRETQKTLFGRATGKTLATVATALETAQVTGRKVVMICPASRLLCKAAADTAMNLSEPLDIPLSRKGEREVKLGNGATVLFTNKGDLSLRGTNAVFLYDPTYHLSSDDNLVYDVLTKKDIQQ